MLYVLLHLSEVLDSPSVSHCIDFCRRFAHLLAKKDVSSPEVKKELLKKVKSAISATAERFSGYMQNVSIIWSMCMLFVVWAALNSCQASSPFGSELGFCLNYDCCLPSARSKLS